ncbi:MAG: glycerol-3-phosphate dehydrogenase/oxidase, partial [Herbaspirillum sp.]
MTQTWETGWRAQIPTLLANQNWDLLIIGGGITGAGILLEAARNGLQALLVEQRDFAWGASSRSSKLVHGGLRYIQQGKLHLTRDSVHERQQLLRDAPGLVTEQSFAFATYRGKKPGRWLFSVGLALYDRMAKQHQRHYYPNDEFLMLAPHIQTTGLQGGLCYTDAKTDDARLVLRVLQEAQVAGGYALNYTGVSELLRHEGRIDGARLLDVASGTNFDIGARVVINATGAWGDALRPASSTPTQRPHLRPLRGSHLIFLAWRLPVAQAISLMHPTDGRPVFAFPWEGVTLVGTTDVDHRADLRDEASITADEVNYLMTALHAQFPQLGLTPDDILSTYAGVRPVIASGKANPSQETREHAIWLEDGLLSVTGGKLTTFRLIALDALRHAAPFLPDWHANLSKKPVFARTPSLPFSTSLGTQQRLRLEGRYGQNASLLVAAAQENEL